MSLEDSLHQQIGKIFNRLQENPSSQSEGVKHLRALYDQHGKMFYVVFMNIVYGILPVKPSQTLNRLVALVVKFSCTLELEGESESCLPFVIVKALLKTGCRASEADVRATTLRLIAQLLSNTDDEHDLSEELFLHLQKQLLSRINDVSTAVRVQAVSALSRLQDASDSKDPVTIAYLSSLESDPNQ